MNYRSSIRSICSFIRDENHLKEWKLIRALIIQPTEATTHTLKKSGALVAKLTGPFHKCICTDCDCWTTQRQRYFTIPAVCSKIRSLSAKNLTTEWQGTLHMNNYHLAIMRAKVLLRHTTWLPIDTWEILSLYKRLTTKREFICSTNATKSLKSLTYILQTPLNHWNL